MDAWQGRLDGKEDPNRYSKDPRCTGVMFCPSCGEEIPDGSAFCTNCGAQIDEGTQPEEADRGAGPEPEPQGSGQPAAASEPAAPSEQAAPAGQARDTGVVGGLEENVAGALAYALGFVTGLVFYLIEEDNKFVRFHAVQSMVVFGGLFVIGFVFSFLQGLVGFGGFADPGTAWMFWFVGLILWLVYMVVMIAAFVLWLALMFKAYSGETWSLPIAGNLAREHS